MLIPSKYILFLEDEKILDKLGNIGGGPSSFASTGSMRIRPNADKKTKEKERQRYRKMSPKKPKGAAGAGGGGGDGEGGEDAAGKLMLSYVFILSYFNTCICTPQRSSIDLK